MKEITIIEEMNLYVHRINLASSTSGRYSNGQKALKLYNEYAEIRDLWEYHPGRNWCDRFVLKDTPAQTEKDEEYSFMNSEEDFSGLYWVGCIGYDPIEKRPIYTGKIGRASDISKRMKNYCTHNPMFWHNNCSLPIRGDKAIQYAEHNAHLFLEYLSLRKSPNTAEWYEFSEDVYFKLCSILQDVRMFNKFANGDTSILSFFKAGC